MSGPYHREANEPNNQCSDCWRRATESVDCFAHRGEKKRRMGGGRGHVVGETAQTVPALLARREPPRLDRPGLVQSAVSLKKLPSKRRVERLRSAGAPQELCA